MDDRREHSGEFVPLRRWNGGFARIGLLGLVLIPIAIIVYVIALPLFGLFWLIEWLLPLHPAEQKQAEPREPFGGMEIASPSGHDYSSPR